MKAITLYQPWASLLACGEKKYETRSWATRYRGKIAIHAGKKLITDNIPNEIHNALCWKGGFNKYKELPLGCIIAIAELVECWHIVAMPGTNVDVAKHIPIGAELDVPKHHPRFHDYIVPSEQELLFGDWTPGRYAWEFKNMQILPEPIPAKGKQRIWNWEENL